MLREEALLGLCLDYLITYIILTEKRIDSITSTNIELRKKVEHLINANQDFLKGFEDSSKKVAFTAGSTGAGGIGSESTLVFPVVINNAGGGYDPGTGIFTAPTAGQYVFYISAQGYSSDTLYVSIVHNGGANVMTMSDGGRRKDFYDSGSNLVTLNLQQGDRVWARCQSGSNYYSEGIPITTFSDFLV
ncbi:complement C1q tumor necrosis factor-related protein 6-like [Saccostrea cucullata]|uniref:complement C1q tumor necrosis factor-related protein 6-like n=1 Tax=Saccostrea cuccullata TaxID=36930 RepID=UPI002ED30DC7